ncbi:hypothetical protein [Salinadaptatus halalkaliphilus]|nr:hypothetical protein [Salinadaptatus halalkaliphilus]
MNRPSARSWWDDRSGGTAAGAEGHASGEPLCETQLYLRAFI